MGRKSYKNAKNKRDRGPFIQIPRSVLNSRAYVEASPHARMLLIDLFEQYRGSNNGDLCAAWKLMRVRGWRSEATLNKAKRELIELGLICETRKGARPNKCSLFAVTWLDLDYCGGKLDIGLSAFPRGAYNLRGSVTPLKAEARRLLQPAK